MLNSGAKRLTGYEKKNIWYRLITR